MSAHPPANASPAKRLAFISHADCGRHDTGWEHPEHVGRLRAIPSALKYHPELFMALVQHEARHANADELRLAHTDRYIAEVARVVQDGGGALDTDTVASPGSWDAATAGAGSVLDGIDMVFDGRADRAFCAVRPPGHHALPDHAMGFCLFGNVGIGAHYALQQHGVERVLVVDWDVHHGNGTQAIVEHEPRIRFVSMHQWPWYPGTGAADERGPHNSVWNVPMPAAQSPIVYLDALRRAIDTATEGFTPDLVLISAGFDLLANDPLGGFTLTAGDVGGMTRDLADRADVWCSGRLVSALEGGYAPERTAEAAIVHMHALRQ